MFNPAVGGWSVGGGVKNFGRPSWGGLEKLKNFSEGGWKFLHCLIMRGFFKVNVLWKGESFIFIFCACVPHYFTEVALLFHVKFS